MRPHLKNIKPIKGETAKMVHGWLAAPKGPMLYQSLRAEPLLSSLGTCTPPQTTLRVRPTPELPPSFKFPKSPLTYYTWTTEQDRNSMAGVVGSGGTGLQRIRIGSMQQCENLFIPKKILESPAQAVL